MAPLERRIGIRRVALVFLSGHVLATLLTELPIASGVALGCGAALEGPAEGDELGQRGGDGVLMASMNQLIVVQPLARSGLR